MGTQVLIEYIDGDIDQPIIVGQLYNGEHTPPYAAGENAPANHIGTVSGIQTKGLDSSHEQHWRLDDAPGQLRHELYSSLADSQLALGYLIEQNGASRGALQGQGFKLATNGWAALRAPEGLLLSSSARRQGVSTQMDVNSAAGQLAMAVEAASRLDDAAQQPGVRTTNSAQADLHQAIDPNQDGHYSAKVNGQNETKPTGNQRDGGDPVERFDKAHLIAEAPSTIALGTPNSLSAFAGEHIHLTSQDDAHIAAGATTSIATGEKANLYAHDGPVQVVAAHGPTSIQAHDDAMAIQADQSVTVTSSTDGIEILAKDKIVLQAGQSSVTIQGANVTFACPGTFTAKGAGHPFAGAAADPAVMAPLPAGKVTTVAPAPPVKTEIEVEVEDESSQPETSYHYQEILEQYYIKEPEYLFVKGVGGNGTFFLKGYVKIEQSELQVNASGYTAAQQLGDVSFYVVAELLRNNEVIEKRNLEIRGASLWEDGSFVPIGSATFELPEPTNLTPLTLRLKGGYSFSKAAGNVYAGPTTREFGITVLEE